MKGSPSGESAGRHPGHRRWAMRAVAALIAITILEVGSVALIRVSNRLLGERFLSRRAILSDQDERIRRLLATNDWRYQLDSVLGWRPRPGFTSPTDTVSRQGLRGFREYGTMPQVGIPRIAAFGDSFVYCHEIPPGHCWTAQLEAERSVEVLNYGVGGYGTDQAYLRYLLTAEEAPPAPEVLIGFAPVNVRRNVNRYARFIDLTDGLLFKPRFIIDGDGELAMIEPPVRDTTELRAFAGRLDALVDAGRHDYWYEAAIYENPLIDWSATVRLVSWIWVKLDKRYLDEDRMWAGGQLNPSSSLFSLQLRLLRTFADSVAADGAHPSYILFADRESVARVRAGLPTLYEQLGDSLAATGWPVLDLAAALARSPSAVDDLFMPGGHYSKAGARVTAEAVAARFALPQRQAVERQLSEGARERPDR